MSLTANHKKNLSVQHLCVALILLPNGMAKIDGQEPLIGWIILSLGALIVFYFIYQLKQKPKNDHTLILVYFVESSALFLTAFGLFGIKRYLPFALTLAGTGYLIAAIIQTVKIKKMKYNASIYHSEVLETSKDENHTK